MSFKRAPDGFFCHLTHEWFDTFSFLICHLQATSEYRILYIRHSEISICCDRCINQLITYNTCITNSGCPWGRRNYFSDTSLDFPVTHLIKYRVFNIQHYSVVSHIKIFTSTRFGPSDFPRCFLKFHFDDESSRCWESHVNIACVSQFIYVNIFSELIVLIQNVLTQL